MSSCSPVRRCPTCAPTSEPLDYLFNEVTHIYRTATVPRKPERLRSQQLFKLLSRLDFTILRIAADVLFYATQVTISICSRAAFLHT